MNAEREKKIQLTAFKHDTGPRRTVAIAKTIGERFSKSALCSGGEEYKESNDKQRIRKRHIPRHLKKITFRAMISLMRLSLKRANLKRNSLKRSRRKYGSVKRSKTTKIMIFVALYSVKLWNGGHDNSGGGGARAMRKRSSAGKRKKIKRIAPR